MNDPYETLGVARTATPDEIRKAWKLLSQRNHPDRGGDPKRAAEINEAWTCLSDDVRRLRYDAKGEDVPSEPVDDEAKRMLHDMFTAAIGNDQVQDIIAWVKQQLMQTSSDLTRGIFDHQQLIKRLAKKRARVRTKQHVNLVHSLIDAKVRSAEAAIEHMKRGILVVAAASGLLEDYEFVPDEPSGTYTNSFIQYQSLQGMFR